MPFGNAGEGVAAFDHVAHRAEGSMGKKAEGG